MYDSKTNKETPENLIKQISKNKNKLYIYEHYLFWFKDYFMQILQTENILMNQEGYLPKTWRYYIALMSISSARCEYLFRILEYINEE